MRNKTKIDIVLGFLESGKTQFINSMLTSDDLQYESIVIIQNEVGNSSVQTNDNITVIEKEENITSDYIKYLLKEYTPDRILLEFNGMDDSSSMLRLFTDKSLKHLCKIDDVITILDTINFNLYFKNMTNIISTQILNSEKIILNNTQNIQKKDLKAILNKIKNINGNSTIIQHNIPLHIKEIHENEYMPLNKNFFNLKIIVLTSLAIFAFTFFSTLLFSNPEVSSEYISIYNKFYTIFISILIEGFPFILLGSFVSSLIQVIIPVERLTKLLSKNIFLSCIIASFCGIFFPICDCGTLPLIKGLIKKNIPVAVCITFMLSAPIVNPITIISTLYAFHGMKSVLISRIVSGIIISIITGMSIYLFTNKKNDILLDNDVAVSCNCSICNQQYNYYQTPRNKVQDVFLHTCNEFFNIGKYMILGTFASSFFQSIISLKSSLYISENEVISLIFMMICAFIFSVCSTSDAFIAKSFLNFFSLNSVMGFLVLGPMLDLKNTFMLFGNFKKKFVFQLMFTIIFVSFFTLLINIIIS